MSDNNIKDTAYSLYMEGLQSCIEALREEEREKIGSLRGGNTGFIDERGVVYGTNSNCPRRSLLRAKGIEADPTTIQNQIMFDGGISNEDIFVERLKDQVDKIYHDSSDYATKWKTQNGTPVTGRPDVIIAAKNGEKIGIELKGLFSLWKARDVLERRPKFDNLLQSAHYFYQLKKNRILDRYELLYINRNYFASNEMAAKWLPKYGAKWSEYLQYRFYELRPKKSGEGWTKGKISEQEYLSMLNTAKADRVIAQPANIIPFCVSYELRWNDNGQLAFRAVGDSEWQESIINWEGIERYYETVSKMEETNELPKRPREVRVDGKDKGYSGCDYCPLKEVCLGSGRDKGAKNVDQFISRTILLLHEK